MGVVEVKFQALLSAVMEMIVMNVKELVSLSA
jgi:hypothetical protein